MDPAAVLFATMLASCGWLFVGGAFAPLISQALLSGTKWSGSIAIYVMVLCVISFVGVSLVKETRGVDLGVGGKQALK